MWWCTIMRRELTTRGDASSLRPLCELPLERSLEISLILWTKIYDLGDIRSTLVTGRNMLNRLNRAVKAVAFGVPTEEGEEMLNAKLESLFMPGPKRREKK
ncbi:unnamed protein product, partial [Musa acuminata subsp. burmannicoides]